MRFLHTADWHLGRTIRGRSRAGEFAAVLDEIAGIAVDEGVDVVLVAGDIWDTASPAPESDRLLFGALRELIGAGIEVVLVGGNHDSPRKLDALGRLSELLGVRTQGLVRPWDQGGVLTIGRNGERARIAAVPWVPDGRMLNAEEILRPEHAALSAYHDRVGEVYAHMAQGFEADAINVFVGHVFVDGALLEAVDGSERRLHIQQNYGISAALLPSRAQYIALGHIHQPQVIEDAPNGGSAAYSGSILQLDFGEREQQKVVRIVDVEPGRPAQHRAVPLTAGRRLTLLRGTLDEVLAQAEGAGDAWLRIVLPVERPEPGLAARVREALPNCVDVRLEVQRSDADEEAPAIAFDQLAPQELFVRYYQAQHGASPSPELVALFREVLDEASAANA